MKKIPCRAGPHNKRLEQSNAPGFQDQLTYGERVRCSSAIRYTAGTGVRFIQWLRHIQKQGSMPKTPINFTLRLTNRLDRDRTVVLEPWTGEYRLDAGSQLDIVVTGSPATPLELELDGERIIITGFDTTDSLLTAYRSGVELRSEHDRHEPQA